MTTLQFQKLAQNGHVLKLQSYRQCSAAGDDKGEIVTVMMGEPVKTSHVRGRGLTQMGTMAAVIQVDHPSCIVLPSKSIPNPLFAGH